jgi:transposase
MFARVVKGSTKSYVHIVQSIRNAEGKPRQKTILNLGPVTENTKESVLKIAQNIINHMNDQHSIVDGTEIQELLRRNWGAPALIERLWSDYSMNKCIKSTTSPAIKLALVQRLISPGSKLQAYKNKDYYDGLNGVSLNQIYRSLDSLANDAPQIKKHLYEQGQHCPEVALFDVTSLYYESQKPDLIRDFGFSKDGKINEVQIILCMVVDTQGSPISYEIFAGNTFEGSTLLPMLAQFKEQFNIKKVLIVADRGIGSRVNLEAIKAAGYEYVIGAKLRSASKVIQELALDPKGLTPMSYKKTEESISYKVIDNKEQKWIILHSDKRANKDRKDREALIEKAESLIERGVHQKRGARRFIKTVVDDDSNKEEVCLDLDKIKEDAKFDGFFAISFSDPTLTPAEICNAYHSLWRIEDSFRTLKSFFRVRPMFHWTKKRIEGHVLLNFIALTMEHKIKQKTGLSHGDLRTALRGMEYSVLELHNSRFLSYASLSEDQAHLLMTLGMTKPKNCRI